MLSNKRRALTVACFVCLVCCSKGFAAESIDLKPHWRVGETTYIETIYDNQDLEKGSAFTSDGRRSHVILTLGFLHTVEAIGENGDARIKLKIDRLAIRYNCDDEALIYDTDNPPKTKDLAEFGKKLKPLLDESLGIAVDRKGLIHKVSGTERIYRLVKPEDKDPNEAQLGILAACLASEAQINFWRQYYGCFAFQQVRIGSTWIRRIASDAALDVKYTLEKIDRNSDGLKVIVSHEAHLERPTAGKRKDGIILLSGPYDASGKTVIDVDRGRVLFGEEKVVQEVQVKEAQPTGENPWWIHVKDNATHKVNVLTKAERDEVKRKTRSNN